MRAIKVYCPPGVEPPLYAFIDALDGKLKAMVGENVMLVVQRYNEEKLQMFGKILSKW